MFGVVPVSSQLRSLEATHPADVVECTSFDEYPGIESDALRANDPNDHLYDGVAALANRDRCCAVLC
jgi:hypothetical protein